MLDGVRGTVFEQCLQVEAFLALVFSHRCDSAPEKPGERTIKNPGQAPRPEAQLRTKAGMPVNRLDAKPSFNQGSGAIFDRSARSGTGHLTPQTMPASVEVFVHLNNGSRGPEVAMDDLA